MAFLEQRGEWFRVIFRQAGVRYTYTLKTTSRKQAETLAGGIEKNLMLVDQQLLHVPAEVDFLEFILSDGKVSKPVVKAEERATQSEILTLKDLKSRYIEVHSLGALEKNSLATIEMHLRHLERTLGVMFNIATLTFANLQDHVTRRSKMKGRITRNRSARPRLAKRSRVSEPCGTGWRRWAWSTERIVTCIPIRSARRFGQSFAGNSPSF